MDVLDSLGMSGLALELALKTDYPSWGYMIYQLMEVPGKYIPSINLSIYFPLCYLYIY